MRLAIMQPYFFPYLGYYQLLHSVDQIVLYDNLQYTKKGWVNRNQIMLNGVVRKISIPVQKAPHDAHIADIQLAAEASKDCAQLLRILHNAYRHSPFFDDLFTFFESIITPASTSLFEYLYYGLSKMAERLELDAKIVRASAIPADHTLKGEARVLAICHACAADDYINLPGGRDLYDPAVFAKEGINLRFIDPELPPYPQHHSTGFVPFLSIIDVLMGAGLSTTRDMVRGGIVK